MNWWMAQRDCHIRGMKLVSIQSVEENQAIVNAISRFIVILT